MRTLMTANILGKFWATTPPLFRGRSTEIGYVYKESTIPYFFL